MLDNTFFNNKNVFQLLKIDSQNKKASQHSVKKKGIVYLSNNTTSLTCPKKP